MAFQPLERAAAIAAGEDKYFTGRPCKHGHVVERRVSNGNCVICEAERVKKHQIKNHDAVLKSARNNYYKYHSEKLDYAKNYRKTHKEQMQAASKRWTDANMHIKLSHNKKRETSKKNRTPLWLNDDELWMIEQAYEISRERSKLFGFKWHVDHIVPLQGKKVSGLHVPWNLQVIPASINLAKHNHF